MPSSASAVRPSSCERGQCRHDRLGRSAGVAELQPARVALTVPAHLGDADPEGREQAGVGMEQDRPDPQSPREGADVLAARSAEAHQNAAARVDAPPDGDLLDRLGHAGVGDLDEARRDLVPRESVSRRAQLSLQRGQRSLHRRSVQREGKALGLDASEEQVDVGEREPRGSAIRGCAEPGPGGAAPAAAPALP